MQNQENLRRLIDLYDRETVNSVLKSTQSESEHIEFGESPSSTTDSAANNYTAASSEGNRPEDRALEIGEDGCVCLDEQADIERIVAENNFLPAHFLSTGAQAQRAVARVVLTQPHLGLAVGRGWGSGFMVSPNLFMTNNHVFSETAFGDKVKAQFNFQRDNDGNQTAVDNYNFDPDNFFYTNTSLDFSLIRLKANCHRQQLRLTQNNINRNIEPRLIDFDFLGDLLAHLRCEHAGDKWGHLQIRRRSVYSVDQRVNIVQHPRGRLKEVSLHDNKIVRVGSNILRYTSDTDNGSSGSPVFNNSWDLVALHHAGGDSDNNGTWFNNEGIRMDKIATHLRSNVDASILQELGI